ELADGEAAERAAARDPEGYLRRREFLTRTAALAGGVGLASLLPAHELVTAAARTQLAAGPYPSPREMPIDTFVVLMMENRSFDHYFGWRDDADGRNTGLSFPDPEGNPVSTYHLAPDFQGCAHPDPAHGWDSGRHQFGDGRLDGFVQGNEEGTGSDEFAAGYYLKDDVPFIPHVADAYQLYDRWFCSIMASTYPNRHFQLGAQNGGQKGNNFPFETEQTAGFEWETIFDRAMASGIEVGYYVSDLPFPLLYGQRSKAWIHPIEQYYADAEAGRLPPITFVDPPFRDGGGGNGVSADEHPHGDVRLGQAFMSDVAHAFIDSPQYARGAMFINYDEWGGFFDHVPPPRVPDDRANPADLYDDWGFCGFRVPAVAISPFTRGGQVNHMSLTHESILKLISYRFGLGYLTKRHRYAADVGRSFDFATPDLEPPDLPDPVAISGAPCAVQDTGVPFPEVIVPVTGGSKEAKADPSRARRPEPHHLDGVETTGWAERMGYEVQPATFDRIFRNPDSVSKALRDAMG
ncbi:MAG: alkaline phosphatase family protein, partial [Solirubrobacterales bacterium]